MVRSWAVDIVKVKKIIIQTQNSKNKREKVNEYSNIIFLKSIILAIILFFNKERIENLIRI